MIPFGLAFGVETHQAGLAPWKAAALSSIVFTGSAQFAAVEVLSRGGAAISAVAAGLLLNLRSLAFGVVMAPSLEGPRWKRALWSHLMIDESTAVGSGQVEARWRRYGFVYTGLAIFATWNISTLVGAIALSSAGHVVTDWGLDATIPAAFLALLWPRLVDRRHVRVALAGALVALALVPVAPPGVPIVAGAVGIAAAWRRSSPPGAA